MARKMMVIGLALFFALLVSGCFEGKKVVHGQLDRVYIDNDKWLEAIDDVPQPALEVAEPVRRIEGTELGYTLLRVGKNSYLTAVVAPHKEIPVGSIVYVTFLRFYDGKFSFVPVVKQESECRD